MQLWFPNAIKDELGNAGSFSGGPFKGVLHTTEAYAYTSARSAYVKNHSNPHFTTSFETGECRVWQHAPINVATLALKNAPGGAQTNKDSAIQIEISGKAIDADKFPIPYLNGIRDLMHWIESQTGIQRIAPQFKSYPSSYGTNGVRFSASKWDNFNGWCGHMHVPENDHGDPGLINIDYLLRGVGPAPVPPKPKDDDMKGRIIQCNTEPKHALGWFFATCDPTPVKWHVETVRFANLLFAYGQASNNTPDQVAEVDFDSWKTIPTT